MATKNNGDNSGIFIILVIIALIILGIECIDIHKENSKKNIKYENSEYSVGDTITFGNYPQDSDGSEEPIEWVILKTKEGSKALIISKYILEERKYHETKGNITWENCDTRKWLNTEFYNEAFDEEEQKKIENTIVRIEDNYRTETEWGNDTRDKIFLLNIDQANNLLDTIDRETEGTEYVKKTYGAEGKQGWWLCSPGCLSDKVAVVRSYGGTDSDGAESSKYYGGIRPALWINSES